MDIGDEDYAENRLFESDAFWRRKRALVGDSNYFEALTQDIIDFWSVLAEKGRAAGFDFITADVAERATEPLTGMLLISHMFPPASERLVARGIKPAILVCAESPVIAWDFYSRLPQISARYQFTCMFEGARGRVRSKGGFEMMFGPSIKRAMFANTPVWADRQLLACMTANKVMEPVSPWELAKAVWARMFSRTPQQERPSIRRQLVCLTDHELGADRLRRKRVAITQLSQVAGLHLYGRGWNRVQPPGDSKELVEAVRASYRGEAGDRWSVLQQYRFTYIIENSSYAGYITEKMFDAMRTGSIPVYDGAPDVGRYVPEGAYLKVSDFSNYRELADRLKTMTVEEAEERRRVAARFLASSDYAVLDTDVSADRLVDLLRRV